MFFFFLNISWACIQIHQISYKIKISSLSWNWRFWQSWAFVHTWRDQSELSESGPSTQRRTCVCNTSCLLPLFPVWSLVVLNTILPLKIFDSKIVSSMLWGPSLHRKVSRLKVPLRKVSPSCEPPKAQLCVGVDWSSVPKSQNKMLSLPPSD